MARECRIKIDLLRLNHSDAIEKELINYLIHEVSNSKRQEIIRTFLKAGYALLAKGQLPTIPLSPSYQPAVQTIAPCHTDVAPDTQVATVQQVDPIPTYDRGQEELEIQDDNNADESECSMDATDPLARLKAKLEG